MSVLINGMEMPKDCRRCRFCRIDLSDSDVIYVDCDAVRETILECKYEESEDAWQELNSKKMSWCPLVEIPPHGRLIDADVLEDDVFSIWMNNEISNDDWIGFRETLGRVPTVIPAEEEQT